MSTSLVTSIHVKVVTFSTLISPPFQIKHVVLINCGATIDVVEMLQPEDNVRFYICDRLVHIFFFLLCNLSVLKSSTFKKKKSKLTFLVLHFCWKKIILKMLLRRYDGPAHY